MSMQISARPAGHLCACAMFKRPVCCSSLFGTLFERANLCGGIGEGDRLWVFVHGRTMVLNPPHPTAYHKNPDDNNTASTLLCLLLVSCDTKLAPVTCFLILLMLLLLLCC